MLYLKWSWDSEFPNLHLWRNLVKKKKEEEALKMR